jgi:segregation and condensation protein A
MSVQEEYKVQLEVFEGPLDLLLYLIKKEEIDIYNIPIEKITTQYMEYLNLMRMLDLNIAGEFLVMAATLMMIKSRMLLPVEDRMEMEEEEEDPRWELVRQLIEYKKFKDIAGHLQEREMTQEGVFKLGGDGVSMGPEDPGLLLEDVSLFDLITAFNNVLKRAKQEEIGEIFAERFNVADKIAAILQAMKDGGQVSFSTLFDERASRHEIICTFLGLLELIRLRQVRIVQKERFGEIVIMAPEQEPEGGAPIAEDESPMPEESPSAPAG